MNRPDRRDIDEANRLYWESDDSVAEIADRLGWSRRALYDAVEPLPTDTACQTCGTPLVFLNRSARSSATTTCITCAAREEETVDDADHDVELTQAYAAEARDRRERVVAAGAAGLLSAGVAAAVTFLLVRRR